MRSFMMNKQILLCASQFNAQGLDNNRIIHAKSCMTNICSQLFHIDGAHCGDQTEPAASLMKLIQIDDTRPQW